MREDYEIGYKNCYISDHEFRMICELPEEVAWTWAKQYFQVEDIKKWLNKLFVIVEEFHGKYIAVYKHDYKFYLYEKEKLIT